MPGHVDIIASSAYLNRPLRSLEQAAHDVDDRRRMQTPSPDVKQRAEARRCAALARAEQEAGQAPR